MSHEATTDDQLQSITIPLPDGGLARIIDGRLHKYHQDGTIKSQRGLTDFEVQLLRFMQELPIVHSGNTRVYPGEPFFILTARDPQAPFLVERWAWDREHAEPGSPKVERAQYIAKMMRLWKTMNPGLGMSAALYPIKYNPKTLLQRLRAVVQDAVVSGLRVRVTESRRTNIETSSDDPVQVLEVFYDNNKSLNSDACETVNCGKERR
jgi:hypothetical protein